MPMGTARSLSVATMDSSAEIREWLATHPKLEVVDIKPLSTGFLLIYRPDPEVGG